MDAENDHVTDVDVRESDDNNNTSNEDAILKIEHPDNRRVSFSEPNVYEAINNDDDEENAPSQYVENGDGNQGNTEQDDESESVDSQQQQQLQQLQNEYENEEQEQEQDGDVQENNSYDGSGGAQQVYENLGDEDDDVTSDRHDDYQESADLEAEEATFDEMVESYDGHNVPDDSNATSQFSVSSAVNDYESPRPASPAASPVPSLRAAPAAEPAPKNANASGKFLMRSSRQHDANSFINLIRQAASTNESAQSDEIMTAIRTTAQLLEEQKRNDRKSVVKEVYVQTYEKNVLSAASGPISPPVVTSHVDSASTKSRVEPMRRPTPAIVSNSNFTVAIPTNTAIEEEQKDQVDQVEEETAVLSIMDAACSPDVAFNSTHEAEAKLSRDLDDEVNSVKSPIVREQPVWLNAALEKQKRSADVIQTLEKTSSVTNAASSQSPAVPPPWIKDRIVKKTFTLPLSGATTAPVTMVASPEQPPAAAAADVSSPTNGIDKTVKTAESNTTTTTPQWKADIETRKKLKSYVVSQKPEQPLRLGTVPEWKRQLSEKSKMKKGNEESSHGPLSGGTTPDSPWRLELAQLKQQSVSTPDEVPEWLRLAEEKQKTTAVSSATNGVK